MDFWHPSENLSYRAFQRKILHAMLAATAACAALFAVGDLSGLNLLGSPQREMTSVSIPLFLLLLWFSRRNPKAYSQIAGIGLSISFVLFTSALTVTDDELRVIWFMLGIGASYLLMGSMVGLLYTAASILLLLICNSRLEHPFSSHAITTLTVAFLWCSALFYIYTSQAANLYLRLTDKKTHYRSLLETVVEGIGITQDGVLKFVNQHLADYLGYAIEDISNKPFLAFVHPDDRKMVQQNHENRLRGEQAPPRYELRLLTANNEVRWFTLTGALVDWEGRPACLSMLNEITAQKRNEAYENFRTDTLEMLAGSVPVDTILQNIVTGMEALHPGMRCSIILLDASGKYFTRPIAPSMPEAFKAAITGAAIGYGVGSCGTAAFLGRRVVVEDIGAHPYWGENYKTLADLAQIESCWSQPIRASNQKILGTFAIYHTHPHTPTEGDITLIEKTADLVSIAIERQRSDERFHNMAYYDSLTGLPNRRLLDDRLSQALATSKRTGAHGAVMLLDLDNFKPLNDEHGHALGDQLLIEVAERLQRSVREVDTVARLGGDEFVIVLNGLDEKPEGSRGQSLSIAEKVRQALAQPYFLQQIDHEENRLIEHLCSASIGIVLFNGQENNSQTELIKRADQAMYRAKETGKNNVWKAF